MNLSFVPFIIIFVTKLKITKTIRYDNYSLYSAMPEDVYQMKFLQNFHTKKYTDVIFWKRPSKLYYKVHFMVNPNDKEMIMERAEHVRLKTTLLLPNVQRAFDNQIISRYLPLKVDSYTWEYYHTLEDIYQWLSDLAFKFPEIVQLYVMGKSVEGRDIYALIIKKGNPKNKVIVEGGIHGNEWISVEFVTYLASQLINSEDTKNPTAQHLMRSCSWFLIPIANPDGYYYNQNKDRLFRKNRNISGDITGVDLNRNFDYSFGQHAVGKEISDDDYCGSGPFSEPESMALKHFILKNSENLKYYFSIHGYGQKLIIPYSGRVNHIDNYSEMENYGKQAILKMFKLYGTKYSIGNYYDVMGRRISGNSASWAKQNLQIKYVFSMYLRDNGTYGYALPPDQILPACQEGMVGLAEIMKAKPRHLRTMLFNNSTLRVFSENWSVKAFYLLLFVLYIVK